jgi:hypothetical protein
MDRTYFVVKHTYFDYKGQPTKRPYHAVYKSELMAERAAHFEPIDYNDAHRHKDGTTMKCEIIPMKGSEVLRRFPNMEFYQRIECD